MKGFTQAGSTISVIKYDETALLKELPVKIYNVIADQGGALHLNIIYDRFDDEAVYGTFNERADKILNSFNTREKSLGALLTGNRGSGKTLLTRVVANKAIDLGLPVIIIDRPFSGGAFNEFMNELGEAVVIFDEFAKHYDKDSKDAVAMLSLLDGTASTKKLFLFTENNEYSINKYMLNRPGRIFYHFRYGKLEEAVITDVCNDKLSDTRKTEEIVELSRTLTEFSFDILLAIIEEANRYPEETVLQLINSLNIDIDNYDVKDYKVRSIEYNGVPIHITDEIAAKTYTMDDYVGFADPNASQNDCSSDDDDDDIEYMHLHKRFLKYKKGDISVFSDDTTTLTVVAVDRQVASYKQYAH